MATRITLLVLASLVGCATGGHPTPDAIYRHPVTGDVQWCDRPSGVGMALGGVIVGAYARLDSTTKLSPGDQQRYEAAIERMDKAKADSIRK